MAVPADTPAQVGSDGEVSAAKWWPSGMLWAKLVGEPALFMGFHYPVLMKVAQDLEHHESKLKQALRTGAPGPVVTESDLAIEHSNN